MKVNDRIEAFVLLGDFLKEFVSKKESEYKLLSDKNNVQVLKNEIEKSHFHNQWFTSDFIYLALKNIAEFLTKENLEKWVLNYNFDSKKDLIIGVVMAGNIPLVGFHDFLAILISGFKFQGKLSSKDDRLIEILSKILIDINPSFKNYITLTSGTLQNFDAIIATGSNNSSRYFEHYFGKYPNIIRKNRNSVAIIEGDETDLDLANLADDTFLYFGLGCRNVSKIYVPENYSFDKLIKAFKKYGEFINHSGFMNNYDYNKSIYLINSIPFLDGDFFLLTEDSSLASPISVIYYEYYKNLDDVKEILENNANSIQCVLAKANSAKFIKFGEAQQPELWDYADGIDTLKFLSNL